MTDWARLDPDAAPARFEQGSTLLLIGAGGAVGTALRFTLEGAFPAAGQSWPLATFVINLSGAFLLGVLLEALALLGQDRGWLRRIRFCVGTGILGGFTTYSTFMVETILLGRGGEYATAFAYTAASLVLGVAGAGAGMVVVAGLHRRRRRARS